MNCAICNKVSPNGEICEECKNAIKKSHGTIEHFKKEKKNKVKKDVSQKKIKEKILVIAIELAKKGYGALFVITVGSNVEYSKLIKQNIPPFSIFKPGADKLLKSIATIDGAVIINKEGMVENYGVMIKKSKPFVGYGTRHAAAMTACKNKNLVILCSEEERKVKIFRDGKFIMQVDALEKNIEKNIPELVTVLESVGAGFIGTVGTITLAPALGIALIPGVLIFGGSYYAIKAIIIHLKKSGIIK